PAVAPYPDTQRLRVLDVYLDAAIQLFRKPDIPHPLGYPASSRVDAGPRELDLLCRFHRCEFYHRICEWELYHGSGNGLPGSDALDLIDALFRIDFAGTRWRHRFARQIRTAQETIPAFALPGQCNLCLR